MVNTDISPVIIAQMNADAAAWPDGPARRNCSWEVADCRSMPQYADESFGTVVDKGTLDAVLCSGTGLGDARCYVSETHRLLAPGGAFLLISLGQPETRLGVLRAQPRRRRRRPSSADAATALPPLWGAAAAVGGSGLTGQAAAAAAAALAAPASTLSSRLAAQMATVAEASAAASALAAGCPSISRREVRWARVAVYLLPKPSLYIQGGATLLGRRTTGSVESGPGRAVVDPSAAAAAAAATSVSADAVSAEEVAASAPLPAPPRRSIAKDEPVAWLGPYELGRELEEALAAPGLDPRDFFYCCEYIAVASAPTPRQSTPQAPLLQSAVTHRSQRLSTPRTSILHRSHLISPPHSSHDVC